MFKLKDLAFVNLRKEAILEVLMAHTTRYKDSLIPYLPRVLNKYFQEKIEKDDYINIPNKVFLKALQNQEMAKN